MTRGRFLIEDLNHDFFEILQGTYWIKNTAKIPRSRNLNISEDVVNTNHSLTVCAYICVLNQVYVVRGDNYLKFMYFWRDTTETLI